MLNKKLECPFLIKLNVWQRTDHAQQEVRISVPYKAERTHGKELTMHAQQEVRISVPYQAECMGKT